MTESQLRDFYYKNYDAVRKALTHVERSTKLAIRTGDKSAIESLTRTQMMLVAVKAEARLYKLLYLPDGFSGSDRDRVFREGSVYDMWVKAVDLGFRRHFNINVQRSIRRSLLHDDAARYDTIVKVLAEDVQPIIAIRNKLAHGQWVRPLNTERSSVDQSACQFVLTENCLTLIHRDNALEGISNIIGDLIQGRRLFQSNFNQYYLRIQRAHEHLISDEYTEWVAYLRRSHRIGQEKMRQNLNRLSIGQDVSHG